MRKQHLFLFLSIICLIMLNWFPIWNFKLGLISDENVYTKLELLALSLKVTIPPQGSMVIPDITPSYWYLNTVGLAGSLVVIFMAFLHFGDLKIQNRWGVLALVSVGIQLIFAFLQINLVVGQYQKALTTDLKTYGNTTVGEFYFRSFFGETALYLIGLSVVFILLAIWSIRSDIKLISSMNRLR